MVDFRARKSFVWLSCHAFSSGKKMKKKDLFGREVLRGRLRQKEVVLLLCSESHEDAMDLTRAGGVVDKRLDG